MAKRRSRGGYEEKSSETLVSMVDSNKTTFEGFTTPL